MHFSFSKPEIGGGASKSFDWADAKYSSFMISFLLALEPRFFSQAEYIYEAGEEVDEQIFVISKDP